MCRFFKNNYEKEMPVIQVDKNGFLKGTNKEYKMKVITLHPVMVKGEYIPKDTKLELQGNDLVYFLNKKMVAPVKEDIVTPAPKTLESETQPALVKNQVKKLGPKEAKEKNITIIKGAGGGTNEC